jgi:SPP1 family phage portal protein
MEIINNMENTAFSESLKANEIAQIIVDKYRESPFVRDVRIADRYYNNHNAEIEKKTRVYYDKDRNKIENPNAHNARIKSNFLRMLVQQKQDYGFAKTFILKLSDDKEQEIELAENEYGAEWKKFLEKSLYKMSYVLAGQAVNHGVAWCYVWINDEGELELKDVPGDLIYPIWKNRQHTKLDKLVYNYRTEKYESMNPTVYEYAELWDNNERHLFNVSDGYVEEDVTKDESGSPIYAHMLNNKGGVSWGEIPFVCFKATDDEKGLLCFVKEQIDSYDILDSKSVDGLIDDLDPILVLKGISPAVGDLLEARELAKMTRTIATDSDGDAGYIQAQTAIQSHLEKMESLRKDIVKFGYGIDYEDSRFGGNPNQLVIKSLYQNLDTYTDGLERHFQDFINDLKFFFDKWYEFTNQGSFEECRKYRVLIKLDRSMMINQSAQIDDTVKLANTGVSRKTLLEFNPVVQDVELEQGRIEEEQKESQGNDLFNFAQKPSTVNGGEYEPTEEKENEE